MRPSLDALRRPAIAVFFVALIALAVQVAAGGFRFDVFGIRLSSNSWLRPVLVLLLIGAFLFRAATRARAVADLRAVDTFVERVSPVIAAAAAAAALAVGVFWGTRAAGGSDSYCYIGQAVEFAHGRATLVEPLAERVAVHRADILFAPVGFVPGARGGAVPMCAPGLSLLMAPAWRLGGDFLLHLVVPTLGALAVWLTFLLGRGLEGPTTGLCAAILIAASPTFLYQIVQPMSDVPAAAFWLATFAMLRSKGRHREVSAGVLASIALLIRPNLAPVLIAVCAFVFYVARVKGTLRFLLGLAPGLCLVLWFNDSRYGSPLKTGYGDAADLFSLSHVLPNAMRYAAWTVTSHTPAILLAFAAPIVARLARVSSTDRVFIRILLFFILLVVGCYLPYSIFDAWWYTRFLLPALPFTLLLASFAACCLASRLAARSVVIAPVLVGLVTWYVGYARRHEAFALKEFERRYIAAGTFVGKTLPANAVVITIQESGAVRYYGRRPAALWDAIAPAELDETIGEFERVGFRPYLLLEEGELDNFRQRFNGERFGSLDWPPAAVIKERVAVSLYDPADRLPNR